MQNDEQSSELAPTPVIPVLGYAEPTTNRPPITFTAEQHTDGVTLSKPLPAEPFKAAALLIIALVATIAAAAIVFGLFDPTRRRSEGSAKATGLIILLGMAALSFNGIRFTKARTLSISLRAGRLVVSNANSVLRSAWMVKSPRAFTVSIGTPDLLKGTTIAQLRVTNRFHIAWTILTSTPKAECLWLAGILNAHLSR